MDFMHEPEKFTQCCVCHKILRGHRWEAAPRFILSVKGIYTLCPDCREAMSMQMGRWAASVRKAG
jgi:hypothetical protein